MIFFAALLLAIPVLAQEGFPPQGITQQFAPMQQSLWPQAPRSGMGYGQQGYAPPSGMGYGYGWQGGRNSMVPQPGYNRGYYRSGPGIMMGEGMMQFGMGPGMIRGVGVTGYISSEAFQKFFDETRELRKELNGLMFDYAELLRQAKQDPAERIKIENKIMALRQKVYDNAPRYQWPFE